MGALSEWAQEQSNWLKLSDGESAIIQYLSYITTTSTRDPEREVVRYSFEINGRAVGLDSGSVALAKAFDLIEPGSWIKITRHGILNQTKYEIEKVTPPEEEKEDNDKKKVETLKPNKD